MTTTTDLTQTLAAVSVQAERYRRLCQRYRLAPDATADDLESAILRKGEHTGFGHAMMAVQEAATEVIKAEKRAYRKGADAATLADW